MLGGKPVVILCRRICHQQHKNLRRVRIATEYLLLLRTSDATVHCQNFKNRVPVLAKVTAIEI